MDHYCVTCGEPWDNDSFHDEADARKKRKRSNERQGATFTLGITYDEVTADFRKRGCKAMVNGFGPQSSCVPQPGTEGRSAVIAEVYELLGDDMDGAASFLEDAENMGLL